MIASPESNPRLWAARVPAPQIGYINAIVESHEGACTVRTRDPAKGLVDFWVMPDFKDEFHRMIEGLRDEFPIEFLSEDTELHVAEE